MGLLKTDITIENLKVFNPQGYDDAVMIDVPYVYMDYDFAALLKRKVHIQRMEVDLKQLQVIRNKDGKINLAYLAPLESKGSGSGSVSKESSSRFKVAIDSLKLKAEKVIYKDYSKNPESPSTGAED